MSYIEQVLGDDEKVVYQARLPRYLYAFAWLSLILLGVVGVGILIFFSIMIRIWTTEIVVTSLRVIYKRGWISRSTEELALQTVEEVNLQQSVLGRMMGFGRVHIRGSGEGEISLPNIADPLGFRRALADVRSAHFHSGR